MSKLEIIINTAMTNRRWLWKLENDAVSIYGEKAYPTEQAAKDAAAEFLNRCMTDRATWPRWAK